MSKSHEELKEATKLVLYGWGYPALFNKPNGDRFQNRLVSFSFKTAPTIAGTSQETLSSVLSRLQVVKNRYRNELRQEASGLNPVWIWVDAPKELSYQERLHYREQFETWVETTRTKPAFVDRLLNSQPLVHWLTKGNSTNWKHKVFATVIFVVITLSVIR